MNGYVKIKPCPKAIEKILQAIKTAETEVKNALENETYLLKNVNWFRKTFLKIYDHKEMERLNNVPFVFCSEWVDDKVFLYAQTEDLYKLLSLFAANESEGAYLDHELVDLYTKFRG